MGEVKQSAPDAGLAPQLELLRRQDKYYLGAGDGLLFAPTHPLWLERPGFWDGLQLFLYQLAPAFTFALVDGRGREISLRQVRREWLPYTLLCEYGGGGLRLVERRTVLPGGTAAAEIAVIDEGSAAHDAWLVAWIALDPTDLAGPHTCHASHDGLRFSTDARDLRGRGATLRIQGNLCFDYAAARSWCIIQSQHARSAPVPPAWDITPFADHWCDDGLDGARLLSTPRQQEPPETPRTVLYAGIARRLALEQGTSVNAAITLRLHAALPTRVNDQTIGVEAAAAGMRTDGASARSRRAWNEYFRGVPTLTCSDTHVERCFAYRWYGLRLNFLDAAGAYTDPTCAEGIGFFHAPISYSAWCHTRDLRWLHDPARARGTLRTFLQHQRADGAIPGVIDVLGADAAVTYFADWGGSLLALDEVHPDRAFLAEAYGGLCRYADHLDAMRDPEGSGLFTVLDPYETGQENMPRYTAVARDATLLHFDYGMRLKGVDLTVYAYRLRRALARVAQVLDRPAETRAHERAADHIGDAVRRQMWDEDEGMFFDVDPATGRRTGIRAAVCFYPYMTDIAGREHLPGLERNLFDPARFWLPFPVPSTSADDPGFSAAGEWEGLRRNCAWNGRVWPMANAHVAEALVRAASIDPALRTRAADFLLRSIRLLFFDGDAARPNSFEHYSPRTGRPAYYRGIDDYQHTWLLDQMIRFIGGFRPEENGFAIDPLPCGLTRLDLERLPYRGALLSLRITDDQVVVTRGAERWRTQIGQPLYVPA